MRDGIKYFLTGMMLGSPIAGRILNDCDKKDNSGLEGKISHGVVERRLAEEGGDYGTNNFSVKDISERYIEERAQEGVGGVGNVAETYVKERVQKEVKIENPKISQQYILPKDISQNGVRLIKQFEGFRATPYDDRGCLAIGYGHRIKDRENLTIVSRGQAEKLLYDDVDYIEKSIADNVEVSLNQNQYDAICSFVYNIGVGAFEDSIFLKKLNNRDYFGAANEVKRWNKSNGEVIKGLARRRNAETDLFNKK